MAWAACYTQPFRELLANSHLRAMGFQTFCPMRLARLHRTGSPQIRRALFSNYLFVDAEPHQHRQVRYGRGVVDLVRTGSEVLTIPPAVIAELKSRCDERGIVPPPILKTGRSYEIARGPFAGLMFLAEQIGSDVVRGWINGYHASIILDCLNPERSVGMTRTEKTRQSRPLETQRTYRDWKAIE